MLIVRFAGLFFPQTIAFAISLILPWPISRSAAAILFVRLLSVSRFRHPAHKCSCSAFNPRTFFSSCLYLARSDGSTHVVCKLFGSQFENFFVSSFRFAAFFFDREILESIVQIVSFFSTHISLMLSAIVEHSQKNNTKTITKFIATENVLCWRVLLKIRTL